MTAPALGTMRKDFSGLINDWGVSARIQRRTTGRNNAGQITATLSSVGTELIWIQPYEGENYNVGGHVDAGILDKMTHQGFEKYSGTAIHANDQLIVSGDTYQYDVVAVEILQTHRHLYLQQVKRS